MKLQPVEQGNIKYGDLEKSRKQEGKDDRVVVKEKVQQVRMEVQQSRDESNQQTEDLLDQ